MPNDDQRNYPGEEGHYNPIPPVANVPPISGYQDQPITNYPLPPTTGVFGTGLQGEKLRYERPKPQNGWKIATLVLLVVVVALASSTAVLVFTRPSTQPISIVPVGTPQPTLGQATGTPVGTSTPSSTPTVQQSTSNNYSAMQPGPGCDKNGGTWTPQGIDNMTCGTQVTISSGILRAFLFLQLPNNQAFSSNNKTGIMGNPDYFQCIGLDEQDVNTGFLVEYCGSGAWFIYTISSDGTIVQTLDKNLTSKRTNVDILLTLKGTTLSFSIDNEVHDVNGISPIQPTKVAITYSYGQSMSRTIATNNFSYTKLSS